MLLPHRRLIPWFLPLVLLSASIAAADPIQPSANLPQTQPWDLAKLSQPPEFKWVDADSPVRSLTFTGEEFEGHPTSVFAYYATPGSVLGDKSLDRNLPAIVCIHGGGGTAFREWAELWARRGYAAIAMDLAGSKPIEGQNPHDQKNRTRLPDGGPSQGDQHKFGRIGDQVHQQWQYHAVANAILAHSLIRSFPEIDKNRTGVTGISWGGYLTCIVAGVDSRFHAAVPVYGCGFLTENSKWLDNFARMTPEHKERWITLWDPKQYLPTVSMPILFVNGTNDFAYPLDSYMKSYQAVPDEVHKQLSITVKMPHSHPAGWNPPQIGHFMDQWLKRGEPMPMVDHPQVKGDHVQLRYDTATVAKAAIHWTTDDKAVNAHDWKSADATVKEDIILAPKPPENAKLWYMTVQTEDGSVVSTEIIFVSQP
ncbi:acylamino acid-releasing protein [Blastopirellula marina]|uniref:Acylamino acid-releasing protein n=1 Tax=Blastopirellula marina TaxID=124 RepID=A0A2S8EZQ5_9BACT|nr:MULTISPECIES: alpha/beta fold hydrolase [Pirellulaceae]PQO25382.1 acylamino acid-releasing protein [Blastopirellula marina]RCS42346.1 acylamino acid-releasing protein [Bremerella cremea]